MYRLDIEFEEVARYLGAKNSDLDEVTIREIQAVTEELRQLVTYKIEYKIVSIIREEEKIKLQGTNLLLKGNDIRKHLQSCEQCILLAVTLGHGVDAALRKLQVLKLEHAVIMDFCASSMIEHLCNQVNDTLKKEWELKQLYLTDRFSPGYGDLPLEMQKDLCQVLDTSKKMGLHVSDMGIMLPRKSITGIIGIASTKQKMRIKGCEYCDLKNECEYRKGGRVCD